MANLTEKEFTHFFEQKLETVKKQIMNAKDDKKTSERLKGEANALANVLEFLKEHKTIREITHYMIENIAYYHSKLSMDEYNYAYVKAALRITRLLVLKGDFDYRVSQVKDEEKKKDE